MLKKRKREIQLAAMRAATELTGAVWHIQPDAIAAVLKVVDQAAGGSCLLPAGDFEAAGNAATISPTIDDLVAIDASRSFAAAEVAAGMNRPASQTGGYSDRVRVVGENVFIPIAGVIRPTADFFVRWYGGTSCEQLRRDVLAAVADPNAKQIVFVVDSPGGSAFGLEETAQTIFNARQKIKTVAYVRGFCASAAYYLASAAAEVVSAPSAATGSIGSIIVHQDNSKYFDELGVKFTAIQFGKYKSDGASYRTLDKQGAETLQKFVDSYGEQFVAAVARNRNVTPAVVNDRFGQGRVFIASEAVAVGLVDRIETFERLTNPAAAAAAESVSLSTAENSVISSADQSANSIGVEKMKNLIALLFGLDLVASVDVDAGTAETAFRAAAVSRGAQVPRNATGGLDIEAAEKMARGWLSARSTAASTSAGGANVETAHVSEMDQARADARETEKNRRREIQAKAALINNGRAAPVVTAEMVDAAIDGDLDVAAIESTWSTQLSAVAPAALNPPRTTGGQAGEDVFTTEAVAVLFDKIGLRSESGVELISEADRNVAARSNLRFLSLKQIAERCLSYENRDVSFMNDEQIGMEALQMGGVEKRPFYSQYSPGASASQYNRPSAFPNILSNLAGKILDSMIEVAPTTYQKWCDRMADTSDFKPSSVSGIGSFTTLDEIPDGDDYQELKMTEEYKGQISVSRKGNVVKLTPVMIANDDLDAFQMALRSLAIAHEYAINRLCVELLANNVALGDGTAIFHANHSNLVTGGGAPSLAQAEKMKLIHGKQTGIGTSDAIYGRVEWVLVPTAHHTAAQQIYTPREILAEPKVPATTAEQNVHRFVGRRDPVIHEPMLNGFSEDVWYTFDSPQRIRTIAYRFMTGYGRGGRRNTWFDPNNECRLFSMEGRFGGSAVGHRGAAKNPGV